MLHFRIIHTFNLMKISIQHWLGARGGGVIIYTLSTTFSTGLYVQYGRTLYSSIYFWATLNRIRTTLLKHVKKHTYMYVDKDLKTQLYINTHALAFWKTRNNHGRTTSWIYGEFFGLLRVLPNYINI
jgi:hypothetical protein